MYDMKYKSYISNFVKHYSHIHYFLILLQFQDKFDICDRPIENIINKYTLFQIEENTRVLEKLGQAIGGDRSSAVATPLGSSHKSGRASVQEKWKMGAKKALLQWCRAQVSNPKSADVTVNFWSPMITVIISQAGQHNIIALKGLLQGTRRTSLSLSLTDHGQVWHRGPRLWQELA